MKAAAAAAQTLLAEEGIDPDALSLILEDFDWDDEQDGDGGPCGLVDAAGGDAAACASDGGTGGAAVGGALSPGGAASCAADILRAMACALGWAEDPPAIWRCCAAGDGAVPFVCEGAAAADTPPADDEPKEGTAEWWFQHRLDRVLPTSDLSGVWAARCAGAGAGPRCFSQGSLAGAHWPSRTPALPPPTQCSVGPVLWAANGEGGWQRHGRRV